MAFYHFRQNNSGGVFDYQVGTNVIIEADSATEANTIAESKGIYFNGCDSEIDCPCCGDRWYEKDGSDKGNEKPSIYGETVDEFKPSFPTAWKEIIVVHYKNGQTERREIGPTEK